MVSEKGTQVCLQAMNRKNPVRKWWIGLFLCVLGVVVLGAVVFFRPDFIQKTRLTTSQTGDFSTIPIVKFTRGDVPCVSVTVEKKTISAEFDLGFWGDISFSHKFLEGVENKKYLYSKVMYGIRGVGYEEKIFEIPKVSIGNVVFSAPVLHEESESLRQSASVVKKQGDPSSNQLGKVGWTLFNKTNLFLDLNNSLIALCNCFETLEEQGYRTSSFVKVPLLVNRGLVEFYIETQEGPLRCMLDTGSTLNILNTKLKEGETLDQAVWDPNKLLDYASFNIGGENFGPITFHCLPIQIPIHIEAVLGMEFLKTHQVFLDFPQNSIYIARDSNF